jgi:hypothetical protein
MGAARELGEDQCGAEAADRVVALRWVGRRWRAGGREAAHGQMEHRADGRPSGPAGVAARVREDREEKIEVE